ncbi:MAG: bifunctional 4-hydroxy-2-oxoglutarate aldolase/2-dehydro-3-deoxy-phosphogluconate aldolase [Clostridiales bacterium]|nr:bifunctional 4-hydroxy-2-oxoglutarate aldolase/2-dehydro-3-deoxy-phosphogluconate aldolase [Clostridiales bacterium]
MDTLETIKRSEIIAIARGIKSEDLIPASLALYRAGIRAFEVTFEQDKPLVRTTESIVALIGSMPGDAVIGAGTVMTTDQVRAAFQAGARFIISPNTERSVIEETKRLGMASIPGAMTPTEIAAAYSYGADIVKVFPAGFLGAEYFKAIKAPLSHIPMAAVAGVTPDNIADFKKAGACAFGISSGVYLKDAVINHDLEAITSAAEEFYARIR